MCGFTGWFESDGVVHPTALVRMRDAIAHRGPDDAGLELLDQGRAGLAFRRLSILDLSPAGHQPMSSADGKRWIIFNGEVYNFAEIRAELESRGETFRSGTDTEVILRSYEHWGEACLQRFIGMFALLIWDGGRRRLFAARDRLGIKPLFWNLELGRLLLAVSRAEGRAAHALLKKRSLVTTLLDVALGRRPMDARTLLKAAW